MNLSNIALTLILIITVSLSMFTGLIVGWTGVEGWQLIGVIVAWTTFVTIIWYPVLTLRGIK